VQRTQGKRVKRVRVELRLPPEVAASLYGWALQANLSLSEAASRAIQRGLPGPAGALAPDVLSNNVFREF
jgi:hypothetical protein